MKGLYVSIFDRITSFSRMFCCSDILWDWAFIIFAQVQQRIYSGFSNRNDNCIPIFSGVHVSSSSRNAIYSPRAILIPLLRDAERSRLNSFLIHIIRESLVRYQLIISWVLSIDASFTIISSQSVKVWYKTDSIASGRYFSPLYVAMIIETFGIFIVLSNQQEQHRKNQWRSYGTIFWVRLRSSLDSHWAMHPTMRSYYSR